MNDIRPFVQTQQQEDPFNIVLGTLMESFVDSATFGIFNPDIVPEQIEQQSPIAATIGHMAGNIAGFFPAFGLANKVVKTTFMAFNFSRKLMTAAKTVETAGKVVQQAKPFVPLALLSVPQTAAAFALHDVAREFVSQTKQNNYDLYQLGKQSLLGAMTGGILGYVGEAFGAENPMKQAMSIASTMTIASAISDAADGIDVLSTDYLKKNVPVTFVTGFGMGLLQSKGWKERRAFKEKIPQEVWEDWINLRVKGDTPDQKVKSIMTMLSDMGYTKKDVLPPELMTAVKQVSKYGLEPAATARKSQNKFKSFVDTLKWDRDTYENFLKEYTGKTTTKGMILEDYNKIFDGLKSYMDETIAKTTITKMRAMGPLEQHFRPPDDLLVAMGAKDLTEALTSAKRMSTHESNIIGTISRNLENIWTRDFAKTQPMVTKIGEAVKNKIFNRVSDAKLELYNVLHGGKRTVTWTPAMEKVFNNYKTISDVMFARLNEARIAMGKEPIPYNKFYMRHDIDILAMKRAGREEEIPLFKYQELASRRKLSKVREESTEKLRTGKEYIYKKDPFAAMRSMVRHDLKTIYLHEPNRLALEEMDILLKNKLITPQIHEDLTTVIKKIIWQQPSATSVRIDKQVQNFLGNNRVGKAIDLMATKLNRDFGGNPTAFMSRTFDNLITAAYIGARPRLAIRNAFQWMYSHSFVSTKSLAKAITMKSDERFIELRDKSLYYQNVRGMIEGQQTATDNPMDKVMYGAFNKSAVFNVDLSMKAAYYQALDYITNPKLAKHGWADAEGIELRKKNPKAVSEGELKRIKMNMEEVANYSQFDYTSMGMALIFRDTAFKSAFKLMSFPMNYWYKFLGNLTSRATTGKPKWAGDEKITLTKSDQYGALKHFVYLGLFVAAMENLGFDYSSMIARSYTPERGFKGGVFTMRPSPGVNMFLGIKDMFSTNEYIRERGRNQLMDMLPVPGLMAYKDIKRSIEKGDPAELFFYRYHKPKVKIKTINSKPFGGGFQPFKSAW